MQKICKRCNLSKPATAEFFWKNKAEADGLLRFCKDCASGEQKKLRQENPRAYRDRVRKSLYGIEGSTYQWMAHGQNNGCAICGEVKPLCVDHDHKTNQIRGLLCRECNTGLGCFKDNPEWLLTAAAYLYTDRQFDPRSVIVLPFVEEIIKGELVAV